MKLPVAALLLLFFAGTGCSVRRFAVNRIGDALAESGSTFATDDDPDLVQAAVPFGLKLMESLLAESPRHRGLLLAACSNFTQYTYAFVAEEADEVEDQDLDKALALRARARRLYLRARDYGLRGLEVRHRDFGRLVRADPKAAVALAKPSDVPLLYWTAASWGLAISVSKDVPDLVADQPQVEALIDRALALDEDYDFGAIHGFLITYESSRLAGEGEFTTRSREHFQRAMTLTGGKLASPLVALAETVSVHQQNRKEFQSLLEQALAIDAGSRPEWRLNNLVAQRRARWLLKRTDELFVE
ncbi:MAG: TRAP transporter TatT component family protein [Bryobacterales bacterium]|nr:TRAP transporter TatT component family protein [Bryobacterales bacterium]